jgi:hypothetical protein
MTRFAKLWLLLTRSRPIPRQYLLPPAALFSDEVAELLSETLAEWRQTSFVFQQRVKPAGLRRS